MGLVGSFIGITIVFMIGVAFVFPVMTSISEQPNSSGVTKKTTDTLLSLFPVSIFIIAIMIVLMVLGNFGSSDDEEDDPETPEDLPEEHDYKKERIWAEELLKRRYARGEISTEEFNERMANL